MSIADLSEKEISSFIDNYKRAGKETGGKFTLAELKLEQKRRIKSPFPPREVAKTIIELAQKSEDGLVSYKQVWEVFRPGAKWIGNAPRTEMSKAFGQVIPYCIDNGLPVLTTLVVLANQRSQSDEAVANICNDVRSLGVDVGPDPRAFVMEQQEKARALVIETLPSENEVD